MNPHCAPWRSSGLIHVGQVGAEQLDTGVAAVLQLVRHVMEGVEDEGGVRPGDEALSERLAYFIHILECVGTPFVDADIQVQVGDGPAGAVARGADDIDVPVAPERWLVRRRNHLADGDAFRREYPGVAGVAHAALDIGPLEVDVAAMRGPTRDAVVLTLGAGVALSGDIDDIDGWWFHAALP